MARTFAGAQITSSRYDGALGALSEPLDAWVADLIAPYLARHPKRERAGDHTFQDRTWRKITLLPWEHYIVKSPALQRLRYIRHLGLSYLTYPSATGSCLEHALGSLARVAAIHDALQRTHPEASILTHRGCEHGVRLSALLHNIGALPLNRVLEPALESSVTDANEMAEDLFSVKLSLETLLSVLIVSSPEFLKLLEAADLPISDPHLRGEGLTEFLCTCIAGSGHTAGTKILFPQIVAGPISAVIMDEVARSAQETGIHLSLDFEDLLNRMRIITSELGGVPDVLHLRIDADDRRTSDELLIACDLVARTIRHHPETRAAEELVAQAIHRVVGSAEGLDAVVRWLEVSDEAVLAGSSARHIAAIGPTSTEDDAGAVDLLRRVKYDDLPGRTFAFSPAILQEWPNALCRLFGGRDGLKRNILQT